MIYQTIFYKDFNVAAKRHGYPLGLRGDTRKKPDKDQRIMSLAGYFERGEWYFNEAEKDNHHMQNLVFQFTAFAAGHTGIKKDGPDACEGASVKVMEAIQTSGKPTYGTRPKSKFAY